MMHAIFCGFGRGCMGRSTLIGADLVRFFESSKMLALLPMCVTGVLGGFCLLLGTLGYAAGSIGIGVTVAITLLNLQVRPR